eukprot:m.142652 g.142652  ORF g.142652 m.142652 type:complete len:137 (-) comp13196_c3_seq1:631-1041(-)
MVEMIWSICGIFVEEKCEFLFLFIPQTTPKGIPFTHCVLFCCGLVLQCTGFDSPPQFNDNGSFASSEDFSSKFWLLPVRYQGEAGALYIEQSLVKSFHRRPSFCTSGISLRGVEGVLSPFSRLLWDFFHFLEKYSL